MNPKIIYSEVFDFCEKKGLIDLLKKQLSASNAELVDHLNIGEKGPDVLDAVHCVLDKRRSMLLLEELDILLKPGDEIIEIGIGTGLLSFFAAAKGGIVHGIELNSQTLLLADEIRIHLEEKMIIPKGSISFILADGTKHTPAKKADLLISENIYTGLFHEKQCEIMDNFLPYLKTGGRVFPTKIISHICLADSAFPHPVSNKEEIVPSPDRNFSIGHEELSVFCEYDTTNFEMPIPPGIDVSIEVRIKKDGAINSLIIYSDVVLPSGKIIGRFDTSFLNGDIFIAIKPEIYVKAGDVLKVSIAYTFGASTHDMEIKITS